MFRVLLLYARGVVDSSSADVMVDVEHDLNADAVAYDGRERSKFPIGNFFEISSLAVCGLSLYISR